MESEIKLKVTGDGGEAISSLDAQSDWSAKKRPVTVKLVPPKSGPMGPNIISELVPQTKYNMLTGPRGTNNNVIHGPPS